MRITIKGQTVTPETIRFKIETDDNTYTFKLHFYHYDDRPMTLDNGALRLGTICEIIHGGTIIGVGMGICMPSETYNPKLGRYYSFMRALQDAGFREQWWEKMWERYIELYGIEEIQFVQQSIGA